VKIFVDKEKAIKLLDFLGFIFVCILVFFMFIDEKLVMKTRYVLQGLCVLKLIFDRKSIRIHGKQIYYCFLLILIVGICFNLISANMRSAHTFASENLKFHDGLMFMLFINNKKRIQYLIYVLTVASLIMASRIIFSEQFVQYKLRFIKHTYIRLRGIITLVLSFFFIYWLEMLKGIKKTQWLKEFIYFFIVMYLFIALGYSDSRMGFLSISFSLITYIIYSFVKIFRKTIEMKKLLLILLSVAISFGISYQLMPESFKREIRTSFKTKGNHSNEARLIMWEGAKRAFLSAPITGVGNTYGNMQPFIEKAAVESKRDKRLIDVFTKQHAFGEAHNMYLNFLAQTGILIFAYLFLLVYLIPKNFWKKNQDEIVCGGFFAVISFCFYGLTWSVWQYYGVIHSFFQIMLALFLTEQDIISGENSEHFLQCERSVL